MAIHKSWKKFQPNVGENLGNYKSYYDRISQYLDDVPKEVVHQWIFPHFNETNSIKNYGWLDLDQIEFNLVTKPTSFFTELNIIDDNEEMVNNYAIKDFAVWHRKYWRDNGTWEVPLIVIDVKSFDEGEIPEESEFHGCYQLVEGHNRLGTLKLLQRDGSITIAESHNVWVISKKIELGTSGH